MMLQMRIARGAALCALLLLVTLFGVSSAKQPTGPAGGVVQPLISVVGGGSATSEFPTAALLSTSVGECSATLIGCQTVLTSAHCVCNLGGTGAACPDGTNLLDTADMAVFLQNGGFFFVQSVEVGPSYAFGVADDVAVLKLQFPVRSIAPSPINMLTQPVSGDAGTIVGFGASAVGGADAGIKRFGTVAVGSCAGAGVPEANYVCFSYDGSTGPDTCLGDSGGPLFADVGAGTTVAGVHSGGTDICNVGDQAFDADVFVNSLWIQSAAGADLGFAACGDGPQVGNPAVTTDAFTGVVTTQVTHSFTVAAGTKELRVALNASLGSPPNDFDLYLRFGAPPTTTTFDCAPLLFGPLEFCSISDPTPGTWYVMVDAFVGGPAEYQVTATKVPEDPAPPSLLAGDFVATDFTAWEVMSVNGSTGARAILSSPLRGSGSNLAAPEGVSIGPGNKIVVANVLDRSLLQINAATGNRIILSGCVDLACASQIGTGLAFRGPRFVSFGPAAMIWMTDRDSANAALTAVVQVDPATGNRSVVSGCQDATCSSIRGTGPALSTLFGIVVLPGGANDIVVATSYGLLRIDPVTGNRTALSGCTDPSCISTVGSGPSFGRPEDLELEGTGAVLVADGNRSTTPFRAIFRVDPATGQRTIVSGCANPACSSTVGTGPLFTSGLIGLTKDASGNLIVSDGLQQALFHVDSVSGNRTVFSGCVDSGCTSLAGSGTEFTDPLGIVTVPEPDLPLGLGACCALLAALALWRRRSLIP